MSKKIVKVDLDLENNKINNLGSPLNQLDAVNKDYIDENYFDLFRIGTWTYDSATTSPPLTNTFRLNDTNLLNATLMHLDYTDLNAFDATDNINNLLLYDTILIQDINNTSNWIYYQVVYGVGMGTYFTFAIKYIVNNGSLTNNNTYKVHLIRSGLSYINIGNAGQILFNGNGSNFESAENVYIDNRDLVLQYNSIGAAIPNSDSVKFFAKLYGGTGGRTMPAIIGPSGMDYTIQPGMWRQKIAYWNAPGNGTTVPGIFGLNALTATGTVTTRTVATTNKLTITKRLGYVSANTANSVAGHRSTDRQYVVGNGSGFGGFFYSCRFGISDATIETQARSFIGLSSLTTAPTNVNPGTLTFCAGIGHNAGDTNWYIYYGGNVAQTRINLTSTIPINNTDLIDFTMWSPPNVDGVIYYHVEIVGTSNIVNGKLGPGTAGVTIPLNGTLLTHRAWRTNNTAAVVVGIDISSVYIETDW